MNLFKFSQDHRKLFLLILNKIYEKTLWIIKNLHEQEKKIFEQKENFKISILSELYQESKVIAMTVTHVACNAKAIAQSGCKFMIIQKDN
jgi:hypothetical protein